jgi:thermostable 8-oxoguanine DNA glycosylase
VLLNWMRGNLGTLDRAIVDKHLMKAMAELCKTRNVSLTKQTIQKSSMIRAERMSLQITHVDTENG